MALRGIEDFSFVSRTHSFFGIVGVVVACIALSLSSTADSSVVVALWFGRIVGVGKLTSHGHHRFGRRCFHSEKSVINQMNTPIRH